MEYSVMKKIGLVIALVFTSLVSAPPIAHAAVTWKTESPTDSYTSPGLDPLWDLSYVTASIFDNDPDEVTFYVHFENYPRVNQFNKDSYLALIFDYNLDEAYDYIIFVDQLLKGSPNGSVTFYPWDVKNKKSISCEVLVFTNIDLNRDWVGFNMSRSCLGIPKVVNVQAATSYPSRAGEVSFDLAPEKPWTMTFSGSATSGSGTSTSNPSTGATHILPAAIQNTSTEAINFTQPPSDLTKLTENLIPAIVTVGCANGTGSGWSSRVELSAGLRSDGYSSYVITNHHVIEDCLTTKKVTLVLSDKSVIEGTIIAWNQSKDIAGIATKKLLPTAEWIGTVPKQGWWVGVLGSPLGQAGILTTGIISSIDLAASTFTLTAPINPGNSGGPIFDSTGRVLGLATSKRLISDGQLAEGFGNAKGTPLLCGAIVNCVVEPNPWGAVSKYSEADAKAAADLKAKQEADAKAAADLKAKQEADAKAAADLKAKQEADAKLSLDAQTKCVNYNGDLKSLKFNISIAATDYPLSKAKFQSLISLFPAEIDCNSIYLSTFDAKYNGEVRLFQNVLNSYDQALKSARELASKKTITCIKGKITKKVTAVNPKCPAGYKKK
jgi:S1-C subfamily serine protease